MTTYAETTIAIGTIFRCCLHSVEQYVHSNLKIEAAPGEIVQCIFASSKTHRLILRENMSWHWYPAAEEEEEREAMRSSK